MHATAHAPDPLLHAPAPDHGPRQSLAPPPDCAAAVRATSAKDDGVQDRGPHPAACEPPPAPPAARPVHLADPTVAGAKRVLAVRSAPPSRDGAPRRRPPASRRDDARAADHAPGHPHRAPAPDCRVLPCPAPAPARAPAVPVTLPDPSSIDADAWCELFVQEVAGGKGPEYCCRNCHRSFRSLELARHHVLYTPCYHALATIVHEFLATHAHQLRSSPSHPVTQSSPSSRHPVVTRAAFSQTGFLPSRSRLRRRRCGS